MKQKETEIKCGEYIGQYIGVIEKSRKTNCHVKNILGEGNGNCFPDAAEKGSLVRFVNHSCNPNCEICLIDVKGENQV